MCWIVLNIFYYIFWNILFQKIKQEKFWTISSLCVLNSFKYFLVYILGQMFQKVRQEHLSKFIKIFQLYQVFMHNFLSQNGKIFIKIFELYQGFVWKSVSLKIGSISFFFFSSSGMQKFYHFSGCNSIGINFSLIFFWVLYVFQIYYAKPKIWQFFINLLKISPD